MKSSILERLKTDAHFRVKTILNISFTANIVYSLFLFIISFIYYSKWFFVVGVYYLSLSLTRVFLFAQLKKDGGKRSRIKTMRDCGWLLLVINLVISIMMIVLIFEKQMVKYNKIVVIAIATYTFTILTMAMIGSVKYLKQNDYIYSCLKLIMLACACVSLTTLTNTMLLTFSEDAFHLRSIILPILCIAVCLFITISAICMIRKAIFDLRTLENEKK